MKEKKSFYEHHFQQDMFNMSDKYARFLSVIGRYKPQNLLDIGCGDGSFAEEIRNTLQIDVHGIDISQKGVEYANKRGVKAGCLDIDVDDLPYSDGFFNCVFCGEVIEHLYCPEHLLSEVYRILSSEGVLILTTPNLGAWYNRLSLLLGFQPIFTDVGLNTSCGHLWPMDPMGHLRIYTYKALRCFLEEHRFIINEARGIGINKKIGFGKSYPLVATIANILFSSPSVNSGIMIVAVKKEAESFL